MKKSEILKIVGVVGRKMKLPQRFLLISPASLSISPYAVKPKYS